MGKIKRRKPAQVEDQQGGEIPPGGGSSTPPSLQERLSNRQRTQFEKIRRGQGKEAASKYKQQAKQKNKTNKPSQPQKPTTEAPSQPPQVAQPELENPEFFYPKLQGTPEDIAAGLDFLGLGNLPDLMERLSPDVFSMGPDNYKPSAYYEQQLKAGTEALDNAYAKRGLFNSGAALQGNADLVARLSAEDVERAKALHTERQGNTINMLNNLLGNYSNTLNNMYGLKAGYDQNAVNNSLNLAEFEHNVGNNKFGNRLALFRELMSLNPLGVASGMTGQGAGLDQSYTGGIADTTGVIYRRPTQTTNFGGGGGGYMAPAPMGPDYSRADQLAVQNEIARLTGQANAGLVNSGQGGVTGSGNSWSQAGQAINTGMNIFNTLFGSGNDPGLVDTVSGWFGY